MKARVAEFLASPGPLLPMALSLFEHQRRVVPLYGRFAGQVTPATLEEIPAVPVGLFKELDFKHSAPSPRALRFHTSGTTTGRPGVHHLPDPDLYEQACATWFRALLPDCPTANTVSLVTPPHTHPQSSLGHMIRHFAPQARWYFSPASGVDREGAWADLNACSAPVFLAATAFALVDLLDGPERAALPAGSVLMVTGGFKGRVQSIEPQELVRRTREALGDQVQLVGEYGMTELSSQLWDLGDGYQAPPWLHVYTVDPLTGTPVHGPGLLRFVDLANWGSVMAIETQDIGELRDGRLHLLGRLDDAPARGCSLDAERLPGGP